MIVNGRTVKYTVFDLETTGLSAADMAEIIEFGGIRLDEDFQEIDRVRWYIQPYGKIPKKITEITHITNDMVANADNVFTVLPRIRSFLGDSIPVGHNSGFDVNFASTCFLKQELPVLGDYIDTMACYRRCAKLQGFSAGRGETNLAACCEHFGIPLVNAHSAIVDADATAKLFRKLHEICPECIAIITNPEQECFEKCMKALLTHNPTKKIREIACDFVDDYDYTEPDKDTVIACFENGEQPVFVSRKLKYDCASVCRLYCRWLTKDKMPKFVAFESRQMNRVMRQMIKHSKDFGDLIELHKRLYDTDAINYGIYGYFNKKYFSFYGKDLKNGK